MNVYNIFWKIYFRIWQGDTHHINAMGCRVLVVYSYYDGIKMYNNKRKDTEKENVDGSFVFFSSRCCCCCIVAS